MTTHSATTRRPHDHDRTPRPRRGGGATALALGVLASLLVPFGMVAGAAPATAATYDTAAYPLKFRSANRVAITPGATGTAVGDVMKYKSVATIDGVTVDAVVRTTALSGTTMTRLDDGSAVTSTPRGSTQTVDDLLLPDINGGTSGVEAMATLDFSFYEGGTYTAVGTGVPVTLANVAINSYDIDANGGARQFTDFRGFQRYSTYTQSSTRGLDVLDGGNGLVRFRAKDPNFNASATTGSYSFSRVKVNYDRISTLTTRFGATGGSMAYFALDFSAGGIWTTNGVDEVLPTEAQNPYNSAPSTADLSPFYVAQETGYVFRSADFPFTDGDNNAFAAVKVVAPPAPGFGTLEFFDGSAWVPVTAGQVITATDLDLGKLRLIPAPDGGSFTFQVGDGLTFSTTATLAYTSPLAAQTIDFPTPAARTGGARQTFASNATASSGLVPVLASETPGVCSVDGLSITTAALPSGVTSATCVVTATQEGSTTVGRAAAVTRQFAVTTLSPQTITFTNPGDRVFSGDPIVTDATTTAAGRTVTLNSSTTDVCTVSGTSIVPVRPGLCSVRATQAGDATYSPASPVVQAFTLLTVPQTIDFPPIGTHALNNSLLLLSPTASSGLVPSLRTTTPDVCSVSDSAVSLVGTGTCILEADQPGNDTYRAAPTVARSFAVFAIGTTELRAGQVGTPYAQTMTVDGAEGGGAWSSSGLPSTLTLDASTGTLTGTPTDAFDGVVRLDYTEGGASHSVKLPLSIAPAAEPTPQTIGFPQPSARALTDGDLVVSPTSDSGLTPTVTSQTPAVCTVSGFQVSFPATGTCTLTASQAGDATRAPAADVTRSFQVFAVTTTTLGSGRVGEPFSQTATVVGAAGTGAWSASGLPDGLSIDSVSGAVSGTPTVTFDGEVGVSYAEDGATHGVVVPLLVKAAASSLPQTITFAQPDTRAVDAGDLVVAPTSDSQLTPTVTSTTPGVCTVSGSVVSFASAGTCTLAADQPGDAVYAPAAQVVRSFRVIGITTEAVPNAKAGTPLRFALRAAGAGVGGVWSVVGALPAGLSLDPATGVVSGTPTESFDGTVTFVYTEGGVEHRVVLGMVVEAASDPVVPPGPGSPTPGGTGTVPPAGSGSPAPGGAGVAGAGDELADGGVRPAGEESDRLASTGAQPSDLASLALALMVLGGLALAGRHLARG